MWWSEECCSNTEATPSSGQSQTFYSLVEAEPTFHGSRTKSGSVFSPKTRREEQRQPGSSDRPLRCSLELAGPSWTGGCTGPIRSRCDGWRLHAWPIRVPPHHEQLGPDLLQDSSLIVMLSASAADARLWLAGVCLWWLVWCLMKRGAGRRGTARGGAVRRQRGVWVSWNVSSEVYLRTEHLQCVSQNLGSIFSSMDAVLLDRCTLCLLSQHTVPPQFNNK